MSPHDHLRRRIAQAAFAFRGYDLVNLGRTPELLEHRAYGPMVEAALHLASRITSDTLRRPVDLVGRVRERADSAGLRTYAEDVALIVAVEIAQIQCLEQFFGIALKHARLAFGYSLGEVGALTAANVYDLDHLLPVLLTLSEDAVALADDVTMGVLFSRGPALDLAVVERLCQEVSQGGAGVVAISALLSPNSVLLLGQADTLDRFQAAGAGVLPPRTSLRRNPHRWPPLHTPITWQRAIPNRAGVMLQKANGGFRAPPLPILSGVTGAASYTPTNSRDLLVRWIDHPQRLWDMVYKTLAGGVKTVVHVGPHPNLVPATFERLAANVRGQLKGFSMNSLGLRAVTHLARRPWLTAILPSSTALLRAPDLEHIILEDWLLHPHTLPTSLGGLANGNGREE